MDYDPARFVASLRKPVFFFAAFAFFAAVAFAQDRRTVTATEARGPITLDGALDEASWRLAQPAIDFVQAEPHEGQAASEATDVRILFDRDALYIGVVCHDATGAPIVATVREALFSRRTSRCQIISPLVA